MSLRIVLFEDLLENRTPVLAALRDALGMVGEVKEFQQGVGKLTEGTFEEQLEKDLLTTPNCPLDLIVADRDLSRYVEHYRGLSESTVRRVADMLGVPECGYARGERGDDEEYIKRGEHREACIRLSRKPGDAIFAKNVVSIGEGFQQIQGKLPGLLKDTGKKTPGKLLAAVLGKPEYAEKIALFATGDQNRLSSLLAVKNSRNDEERHRRLACFLGYWLWDSVLRFPGVVLNDVAASSYLNIKLEAFRDEAAIRELFSAAAYTGPFAAAKRPLWWRGVLDDLISDSKADDGRGFATQKLGREIARSECCEDATKPAGYYCFLSDRPVSLENSKAGLTWFPRGADLARVSKSKFDEDEPWL